MKKDMQKMAAMVAVIVLVVAAWTLFCAPTLHADYAWTPPPDPRGNYPVTFTPTPTVVAE